MLTSSTANLWQETPLIYSNCISDVLGVSAYLKLENLHPSYSFKYRGVSHFIRRAKEENGSSAHFVIASGGNAGLAAACAANSLGVRCSVYIPEGVAQKTLELLQREGARVIVTGRHYAEALRAAEEVVAKDADAVMVPAYDDENLWEGHSSMITEIFNNIPTKPDAIFCSVGGGGLLGGLIVGCKNIGWDHVPIVALETIGSDCFYHSMSLNNNRSGSAHVLPQGVDLVHDDANDVSLAHFSGFTSRASGSLGASQPAAKVVRMALQREGGVKCVSVPDELSMQTLISFAEDQKILVELACSTTLVPAYKPALFDKLVPTKSSSEQKRTVVFIICGGFKISLEEVAEYKKLVDEDLLAGNGTWDVHCGGEIFKVEN